MSITEFLLARIAEDEALAELAAVSMHGQRHDDRWDYAGYVLGAERDATPEQDEFITAWWPVRVLAECAAKRAMVAECRPGTLDDLDCSEDDSPAPMWVARALAAVYKDHPDYQQEWAA